MFQRRIALTLLICIFSTKAIEESRKKCSDISLEVSGDGIVKLGDTLTLTMGIPTDEDDSECVADFNDKKLCKLSKDESATTLSCKGKEDLFTGEITEDKCIFTIRNMTEDFIGKIELEIGFCEKSSDLSLFKETTITEVIVPGEDGVTENEQVEVECHVMKGSFETEVSFMLMSGDEEDHERTFNMTARADNDMTDVYKATVAFKREDQGKKLCCQALQKNGDQEIGNVTKMSNTGLNIWFLDEPRISNDAGHLKVTVESNPEPKLNAVCEQEVDACKTLNISGLVFEKVSDSDNEFKYESHRQLFDTKQEWMNNASLRINVTNDKVQAKSEVTSLIGAKDEETTADNDLDNPDENSTKEDNDEKDEGGNAGLTAVIVILVIVGVLGGVWYYKKRKSSQVERQPLSSQSMSSLN